MKERSSETKEWIITILSTILLIIVIRTYIFSPVVVEGDSMNPTLLDGDRLFINKIGMYVGELERLDIVVFKTRKNEYYIKRIIGMPGDKIEFLESQLYINGELVNEPYINPDAFQRDLSIDSLYGIERIPDEFYFVVGDNRSNSMDSRQRSIGLIHESEILGSANLIVWPIDRIKNVNKEKKEVSID